MHRLLPLGASSALLVSLAGAQSVAPSAADAPSAAPFWFDPSGVIARSTTAGGLAIEVSPRGLAVTPVGGGWALNLYAYDVSAVGEPIESAAGAPRRGLDGVDVLRDGFRENVRVADSVARLQWTIEPTADARGLAADELWLGLRAHGLDVSIDADGHGATLTDPAGVARLALDGVVATDAAGTELETRLVNGGDGLGVRIDAPNALYPITLEPTLAPVESSANDVAAEEDLVLLVAESGAPRKRALTTVEAGGTITVHVASPSGKYDGEVGVLLFDGFAGDDAVLAGGGVAIDPRSAAGRLRSFVLSKGGTRWSMPVPQVAGMANASVVLQGFAMSSSSGASSQAPATNATGVRTRRTEIYVSATFGAAGAAGTRTAPVATVEEAYAMAAGLWSPAYGYPGLLIEGGTYSEDLDIDLPVSMRGGLDATTWTADPTNPTIIVADHSGTWFDGTSAPTTIQDIEFRSDDAPISSSSGWAPLSRAVLVLDSSLALSFVDCTFASGEGARGVDGSTPGSVPGPANHGQAGDNANAVPYTETNGGASFAADLRDASPVFEDCVFSAGRGGEGGDGGQGLIGGIGGFGGQGGNSFEGSFGALGASFTLGLGAGGHGGPSAGVYMAGTSAPPALLTNNTIVQGAGGAAGSGGRNADDGSTGPAQAIWQ